MKGNCFLKHFQICFLILLSQHCANFSAMAGQQFLAESRHFPAHELQKLGKVQTKSGLECLGALIGWDFLLTPYECTQDGWGNGEAKPVFYPYLKKGKPGPVPYKTAWRPNDGRHGYRWSIWEFHHSLERGNLGTTFLDSQSPKFTAPGQRFTLIGYTGKFNGGKAPAIQEDCQFRRIPDTTTYSTTCAGLYDRPGILIVDQEDDHVVALAKVVSTEKEVKATRIMVLDIAGANEFQQRFSELNRNVDQRRAQYLAPIARQREASSRTSSEPRPSSQSLGAKSIAEAILTGIQQGTQQAQQRNAEMARQREAQRQAESARQQQTQAAQQQRQTELIRQQQQQTQQASTAIPNRASVNHGKAPSGLLPNLAATQCVNIILEDGGRRAGGAFGGNGADIENRCSFPITVAYCSLGGDFNCDAPHKMDSTGVFVVKFGGDMVKPGSKTMISTMGNSYGKGFVYFACRAKDDSGRDVTPLLTSSNPVHGNCYIPSWATRDVP